MADSWLQVHVEAPRADVATVEFLLGELGALVTWTEGAADEQVLEPEPGAMPLWEMVRVTALLDPGNDPDDIRTALARALPAAAAGIAFKLIPDRDWDAEWRRQLKPLQFGRRLWVCPAGQHCPVAGDVSIILEPGMAFGTGTHPTTAMCLEWLGDLECTGARVLDFGCGSGILGIAALALGATTATGVDIDKQALLASGENAARNGFTGRLTLCPPDDIPTGPTFNIVVANILSGPLVGLAPALRRRAGPATRVALSGILAAQAAQVCAAYRDWVELGIAAERDGWVLLTGRCPDRAPG